MSQRRSSSRGMGPWLCLLVALTPIAARADPPPALLQRSIVATATRRAVARAGLEPWVTHDLAVRARAAGWMPHVSLRVMRGLAASTTQTYQPVERATSDDSLVLDARVRFSLDRLVFDHNEVAIARLELERFERRAAIERLVLDLLTALQRAAIDLQALPPESPEASLAQLEFASARARLESLTGATYESLLRGR